MDQGGLEDGSKEKASYECMIHNVPSPSMLDFAMITTLGRITADCEEITQMEPASREPNWDHRYFYNKKLNRM